MISKSNIFKAIHELKSKYNISTLYKIGIVSRSAYYKWLSSNIINDNDLKLKYKILKIYNESKKVYGYSRIKVELDIVIKDSIINPISTNLCLRNMELHKVCNEKETVMIMHALKISLYI